MYYFTDKDYKQIFLNFIREEKRSNAMTKARSQPFCIATNINIGYFNGKEVHPRSVTERNKALYSYNNHFCLIWTSDGVSFSKAIEELKVNITMVNNYIA